MNFITRQAAYKEIRIRDKEIDRITEEQEQIFPKIQRNIFPSEYFAKNPDAAKRYEYLEARRKEIVKYNIKIMHNIVKEF